MSNPVADLRKRGIALRKALEASLRKPRPEPVHKLRTHIRRIEAQLKLISLLPSSPDITAQSRRFLKTAKAIRQTAGNLRDVDVHINQLAELPEITSTKALTKALNRRRDRQADKLQRALHKHRTKLFSALDDLEVALRPARTLTLSPSAVNHLAFHWFDDATSTLNPADPAQLHDLRKAAKLARYMAEIASSSTPSPTARHFSEIQQAIGDWHDWLTLTDFARQHLPLSSPLLATLKQRRDNLHRKALIAAHTPPPPSS
jgi:CHAD domain-containing protein